ncbi:MAG: hypothetical protein ACRETI_10890 [Steroidobacteraceae bacterium]
MNKSQLLKELRIDRDAAAAQQAEAEASSANAEREYACQPVTTALRTA